jgi:hypothetical protein
VEVGVDNLSLGVGGGPAFGEDAGQTAQDAEKADGWFEQPVAGGECEPHDADDCGGADAAEGGECDQ